MNIQELSDNSLPRALAITAMAVFCVTFAGSAPLVCAAAGNRIAAIVNDEIITQQELEARIHDVLNMSQNAPPAGSEQEIQKVVLQRLIEQRLILQEGKRLDIKVTDEDVNAKIQSMKEQIGSEEGFENWMKESKLSIAEVKRSIRDQLLVQRTVDAKVRSTIVVSPQEVSESLADTEVSEAPDQVLAYHMLIRVGESRTEEEARARLEEVLGKLGQGESFETLAKEYSDDPQAESGGKLGWVTPGQLLPELDEVLFALSPGQISEPIESRLGFHLLRADQRRTGVQLSEIDANHAAYKKIYEKKFQEALAGWLKELNRQAYIEIPKG